MWKNPATGMDETHVGGEPAGFIIKLENGFNSDAAPSWRCESRVQDRQSFSELLAHAKLMRRLTRLLFPC